MKMSNFNSDRYKEKIISKYLNNVYEKNNFNYERCDDLINQHSGIDLILTYKNSKYYVDEKSQTNYINKDLPTFTFELSYLSYDEIKTGWFLDDFKKTTHYFLITSIFFKA